MLKYKKKKIIVFSIILTIIIIVVSFYSIDKMKFKNNEEPLFTFYTIYYKDGGTEYKIGLGYAVVLWKQLSEINLNNTEILGYEIGKEFVNFPFCYSNIFSHNFEPNVELEFVPK